MAIEAEKKSWMAHLPGIMGGSAALIAALTTVYVNLRHAPQDTASVTPAATPHTASNESGSVPVAVSVPALPMKVAFQLERILTQNDGSLGTTDWVFEVDAAGSPLYSLPVKSLDDSEGKNLRMIPASAPASSVLEVSGAAATAVSVKGWKHGLLGVGGAPDVTGQGWLASGVDTVKVDTKSAKANGAAFVFYFSAPEISAASK